MAMASSVERTARGGGAVAVVVYLGLIAAVLFLYVRGWLFLGPYTTNILSGLPIAVPTDLYPRLLLMLLVLVPVFVFRAQVGVFLRRIPLGLRGLLVPLPFYLLFSFNWQIGLAILVIGALAWVFSNALATFLPALLQPVPALVRMPLMRLWPAVLYTALFTGDLFATVVAAVTVGIFHHLDSWMEQYFQPVWLWHRSLPVNLGRGIFVLRLIVGITIPFVLSYSVGLFNPLIERFTPLFTVFVVLVTYFVMRMPRGTPANQEG